MNSQTKNSLIIALVFVFAHVTLSLILSGCGAQDGGSDSPSSKQDTENRGLDPANPRAGVATSYYVAKESDLRPCSDETLGFLAYVKETEEFKACFKSGWETVNIKGKDGRDGKDGSQGVAGTNGKDGTSAVANDNSWTDPVSGKKWLIGATTSSYTPYNTGCASGYTLPTPAEGLQAVLNGLGAVAQRLNGTSQVWTKRSDPSVVTFINTNPAVKDYTDGTANAQNTNAVLACYKN